MTVTTMTYNHRTIRECPEEIIVRCAVETDLRKPRGFLTDRRTG